MRRNSIHQIIILSLGAVGIIIGVMSRLTELAVLLNPLIIMLTILGLAVMFFISLFRGDKRPAFKWLLPLISCPILIVGIWMSPLLGEEICDYRFKLNIGKYEAIVKDIREGRIALSRIDISKIKDLPPGTIDIQAMRCSKDGVIVSFLHYSTGAVGVHIGYVLKDLEDSDSCLPGFYRYYPVMGKWYCFVF
jgi:hypothetical protein